MATLVILSMVTGLLGFALVRSNIMAAKLARCSWEDLVGKLHPIESEGVTLVALDYLEPGGRSGAAAGNDQLRLEPETMWTMLGGLEGLQRMRENAGVLIALASYVERWNFDEGVVIAERMRRDGLQLRRAVTRVMIGTFLGRGRVRIPFYLHEAASSYYLMRQRLLALYRANHVGLYPLLAEAV